MYLAVVLIYLVALAVLGIRRMRGAAQTSDDFLVAGRSLPASILVFTLFSAWIGSGSLFAWAGLGYQVGLPALWQSAGAWAGIAVVFFLAPRVRRLGQYTVPDILELKYGSTARVLGTLTIVFAYTTIAAYQFRGGGRLLHLIAGLDPATGALITAVFCVIFTSAGGMRSIATLDVVNGLTILGGVGIALVYLLGRAGGAGAMSPIQAIALFLPTIGLLLGEASMYQKFFSARDERAARLAVVGWIAGTIAVESMIVGLGLLGSAGIPGLGIVESETIVVRIATDVLPAVIGAVLLAACAAIIVSTANSMLLSPATNLVRDIYQRSLRPTASTTEIVLATRLAIAALGALGLVAGSFLPTVLSMALWSYTMYGAGITPALIAALVWPRATPQAGTTSIAAAMLVTLLWEIVARSRGNATAPQYLLGLQTIYPALAASVGTLVLLTIKPAFAGSRFAGSRAR
jgi:SSS family solute:Na+ symporter/sodium/proline symporter